MALLEQETNLSYENSNIETRVRIVHAYETSYGGSGSFSTDLTYFLNTTNEEAAELDDLRELHNADIKILLTGRQGYWGFCGQASGIGVDASTAIAVATEECVTGYFSFGHEIGHLFGTRHIMSEDPSLVPFPYGHGYCNTTAETWRTVMAYFCPSNTGGARLPYWSNPNVFIDNQPTGAPTYERNARVINERASEVANFR